MRKIRMTIEFELYDLSNEKRTELAEQTGENANALPRLADFSAADFADSVIGTLGLEDTQSEIFAGSEIYAQIEVVSLAGFEELTP